ncbi:putative uncharacterized protein encoded by LINC00614 [Carassius carassius]|uniref:putative uncharacterized protein encoded by LINC00614 n=1 Tax=Carassius carassius TaxID=217509 RepID=UPI0028683CC9|nr:putative uncharacterized protein encoded by LINC00614 [Carassius carassius]
MDNDDEIAVVGIGCHFPGGEGLENFWRVLLHGENCAVQIPNDRFNLSQWYDPDESKPGKTHTAKAALIDGLNEFDHKFFGITNAETMTLDPQHKVLLECTYRALEDAGIPMEKASGTRTGVFLGNEQMRWLQLRARDCDMALCGGVTCILEPTIFVALSKARMISSDGMSKPFFSKADGYGRGFRRP